MKINLTLLGEAQFPVSWFLGEVTTIQPSTVAINSIVDKASTSTGVDAWLFWDPALGSPDGEAIESVFCSQGDVWHAGLKLGTRGLPQAVDFVHPIWMLNCDPKKDVSAVSWRLSFRACMVRTEVFRKMGGLRSGFQSLEGAALEFGHRLLKRGVILRYTPEMLKRFASSSEEPLSVHDELLFAKFRFPSFWYRWTVFRALASGAMPRFEVLKCLPQIARFDRVQDVHPFDHLAAKEKTAPRLTDARVTVLLPTIDRYPYLITLLNQLRQQTVRAHEIIVIDQTPLPTRDGRLVDDFRDLPLTWIHLDEAGQCSSRNAGLRESEGNFILFLDDDDEIGDDLIERHLRCLEEYVCDVSCGVADEVGVDPLEDNLAFARQSDVFPTNNTMIKRKVLYRSGLFDLAYDRGQRADGDLGMRVCLSGHHMVLNPRISVLHHHAPIGGLRTHGQRVVTRASSRKSFTQMNLASRSDIYLAKRYFSPRQVREMLWINVFSTVSMRASMPKRVLKLFVGLIMLPIVLKRLRRNYVDAEEMLEQYPQIEAMKESCVAGQVSSARTSSD